MSTSKTSTVGVVILSFNKRWILPQFFESLAAQTRKPDKAIIVDDCSKDGTPELLRVAYWRYPTIRLPKNLGQGAARNIGVRCLKTTFVLFLDGDIVMEPDMIEAMESSLLANPETSIAYCHYKREGSRTDDVKSMAWNPDHLKLVNYVSMISMVRREHLPTPVMDESLRRYEDWDLWIRMMKAGRSGILVDRALFTAHYQKGDLSGTGESEEWRRIVEKKHGLARTTSVPPI